MKTRSRYHHAAIMTAAFLLIALPAHASETYTYDAAGRLTHVIYDDSSSITYAYDANGNIVSIVAAAKPTGIAAKPALPTLLAIDEIVPNPTAGDALVRFQVSPGTRATLVMTDVLGRETTVADRVIGHGAHSAVLFSRSQPLRPGVYGVILRGAGKTTMRKLVVVR